MICELGWILAVCVRRVWYPSFETLELFAKEELARRVEREPPGEVLAVSGTDGATLRHTCRSTACPARRRAISFASAVSVWRAKMSKSDTRSRLKNGRVMLR